MRSYLRCPVTVLKAYKDFLITGQGSRIIIYSLKSQCQVYACDIFRRSRVHKLCSFTEYPDYFIVLGGKVARCVKLVMKKSQAWVEFVTAEKEFKGWIWDCTKISHSEILLISAHNTVILWDTSTDNERLFSSCYQQCILYSATFLVNADGVFVASGTVFNHVLLWKVNSSDEEHSFVAVWKRFVGHEGVIFRIGFHTSGEQLLSVSDDRSIRLWSIPEELCLKIFYGHSARVWDAVFLHENIVSIGEDSVCLLWNMDGLVQRKYSGHKGKSIWSLDATDDHIFTGGGDGGIRMWSVADEGVISTEGVLQMSLPSTRCEEGDFARTLKLLDHDTVIMSTNSGLLMQWRFSTGSWTTLSSDRSFKSYCCADIIEQFIAIGNLFGLVKIISSDNGCVVTEEQSFSGKIFNLLWLKMNDNMFLLLSGPDGHIKLFCFLPELCQLSLIGGFSLPYSRQRWAASAGLVSNAANDIYIVCGDRRGSLHVYTSSNKEPVQSILGAHGKTGVTSVSVQKDVVYTTGRDGKYKMYEIGSNEQLQMVDQKKACRGMDWIEGIWFHKEDLIIYGFYMQSFFAAWNSCSNQLLFKIPCGGGYRAWDVKFPVIPVHMRMTFTYLKGPVVNVLSSDWHEKSEGEIIQEGLHGRDVLALKMLAERVRKDQSVDWLLATCSEDTTIAFHTFCGSCFELTSIHTIVGHIGGVKDIYYVEDNVNETSVGGWFISCGTRTSYKLWKLLDNDVPACGCQSQSEKHSSLDKKCLDDGSGSKRLTCWLAAEIFNPEISMKQLKLKNHDVIDDMRYMSTTAFSFADVCQVQDTELFRDTLCCVAACSDGVARVYYYSSRKFGLLTMLIAHNHCVQNVKHFITSNGDGAKKCHVFTSATDGKVIVWDITDILMQFVFNHEHQPEKTFSSPGIHVNSNKFKFHDIDTPLYPPAIGFELQLHQSGVNALDVMEAVNGFEILTGGDDSMLCWKKIEHSVNVFDITAEITHPFSHLSSVSAVKFISEDTCVSTSIDQRLKIWRIDPTNSQLVTIREYYTSVADVSNMEVWTNSDDIYIAVCGIGLEIFHSTSCQPFSTIQKVSKVEV